MFALLVFIALPALAREDSLARLQKQHAELCEVTLEKLGRLRQEREAYPSAADPDQALQQWALLLDETGKFYEKEDRIRSEHREMLKALTGAAVTRAISGLIQRSYTPDMGSAKIYSDETSAGEMRRLSRSVGDAIQAEAQAFRRAVQEREESKQHKRYVLYGLYGAVAFLLAALLIIAPWRRGAVPQALPAPEALALLGGNFEVGELIGRGAMGEVFSAVDKTLTRRVALKRMRPELLAEPKDRERFLSEARLVAALKHPNIVAIHSVVQEGGETYLVFEFVDGKTLEELIREKSRLPWQEALACLKSVCSALEYAHSKGVIHRDLKPGNIMLTPEGALKVMDFGIAHQARVSASRMTRATSMGTPPYMSPEQELGGVSAGVDLYAATVCFYEMLTGRLPFSGPNFLAQKREEVYEPASSSAPGLPPGIDAFFKAALAPQPSLRPKNAGSLYSAAEASLS